MLLTKNNFMKLFREELVNLNNNATDKKVFFDNAYTKLFEQGYVKDSFEKAITKREDKYPTGLALENINIAIPHTDTEHIKEPFVYINRLNKELEFNQMGNEDEVVSVEEVWILGIKDGSKQVNLLAYIMDIFNNPEFIDKYHNSVTSEEVIDLLKNYVK